MEPDFEHLLATVDALANPHRLRIVAALSRERTYVSALARELGLSRPLLYMHLGKLEESGLVKGKLELSEDGKAMKYYEVEPFTLRLDPERIRRAVDAARTGRA